MKKKNNDAVIKRVQTSVQNMALKWFFYGKRYTILKHRNIKMCEHSIFSIIGQKYV